MGGCSSVGHATADGGTLKVASIVQAMARLLKPLLGWECAGLVIAITAITVLVYQLPRGWQVDIGGPYDAPWVSGFHDREGDRNFSWRWTTSEARINLPGLGAGWYDLYLNMAAGGSARSFPVVSVLINGKPKAQFEVKANYSSYRIALSPRDFLAGDLEVTVRSDTFVPPRDPRLLGVAVDSLLLQPTVSFGRLPSFGTLAFALLAGFICVMALSLGRVGRKVTWATLIMILAVYTLGLAANRVEVATFLPRFVLACLLSAPIPYVVTGLLQPPSSRSEPSNPRVTDRTWQTTSPAQQRLTLAHTVAALAFVVGLVKIGGTLYPQIVIIDLPFHTAQIRQVLAGNFWKLYLPGPLSLAVMPEKEWTVRAPIPYSPFFYLFAAPIALLPADVRLSVPLLNALLEAWKLPMVIMLGLRLKLSRDEAGLGGAVYGLAAAMYMLLQWGNWPTTFSQWFALAGLTTLLGARKWATRTVATFLLGVAFISYTVTAAFLLTMLLAMAVVLIVWGRAGKGGKRLALAVLVLIAGWIIAFVGYYWAHLYVAVTQTLPAFAGALAAQGTLTTRSGSLSQYLLGNLTALGNYGLLPILITGMWGAALMWPRWVIYRRAVVAAWILVLFVYFLIGFKVDMVLKHVWFVVPLMSALSGALLTSAIRRGRAGIFLTLGYTGTLAWTSAWLWTWRIWEASH
jgi:hypothetical protein